MGPSLVESANQCCRSKIFRCGSRSTYFVMMPIRILAPRLRLYLDPNPEPGGKLLDKKSFCKSCKTKNSNFFCKCYGKSWEINESRMTIKMFFLSSLLLLASYYHTLRIRSPDKTLKIKFVRPTNGDWSWLGPNPQHSVPDWVQIRSTVHDWIQVRSAEATILVRQNVTLPV